MVIFGGTFDPVHNGHLIVARCIAESRNLPRVHLQPAASPPHKSSARAEAKHRLEMLRLAIADEPRLAVSDLELRRSGPSYTFDAVEAMLRQGVAERIHWVIGADMLADLPDWHRAAELVERIGFYIAARPGWDERMPDIRRRLAETFGDKSAGRILEGVVDTPRIEISSTEVRERCGKGLSIRYLVPEAVGDYIRRMGLYTEA
jgi:nicotinate-nucleotide adenylyltransferase